MRAIPMTIVATLTLAVAAPRDCLAQRLAPAFVTWSPSTSLAAEPASAFFGHPEDHRWEGVLVGGAGLGIVSAALGYALCEMGDGGLSTSCAGAAVGSALVGALAGGIAGGRMGGAILKRPTPFAAAPTPAGLGHPVDHRWEGVLVGSVGLGIYGAALGNGMCQLDDSSASPNCVGIAIATALVGALTGGIAGGLIGGLIPRESSSLVAP